MSQKREILPGFIVLEGIDGSGTTTQLKRLETRFKKLHIRSCFSFEPSNGPVGELIREALSGRFNALPSTIARLFAADRAEHLYGSKGIVDQLKAGKIAVSDRYLFSSLAYQGLTCGEELPAMLNASFPLPELLLFFKLDPDTAISRMQSRKGLEIYENLDFQKRVANAYDRVVSSFDDSGMKIVCLDASNNPELVEEAVWQAVSAILPA